MRRAVDRGEGRAVEWGGGKPLVPSSALSDVGDQRTNDRNCPDRYESVVYQRVPLRGRLAACRHAGYGERNRQCSENDPEDRIFTRCSYLRSRRPASSGHRNRENSPALLESVIGGAIRRAKDVRAA